MNPTVNTLFKILFLCALFTQAFAQQGTEMTMENAIQYALDNSADIRIARLNIEDAELQIIETRATGLPQLNGDASFNHYFKLPVSVLPAAFEELIRLGNGGELPPGFSNQIAFALKNNFQAGVNLKTMVFDGSFFTGLRAAELYRNLVQDELAAKSQTLKNQVIEAYLPTVILQENIKITDKNIANVEKLLYETNALFQEGFVEQLDVDRLKLTLANLQTERENISRQFQQTLNGLKFVMNFPIEKELVIADIDNWKSAILPLSQDDLEGKIDYFHRLNYKAAETGILLNELNIDYTKKQYLPTVYLNASYNQAFQGNSLFNDPNSFWAPTGVIGMSLKVPIFDSFGKRAKIEKARLVTEIARAQQSQLARLIDMEVANARIQYKNAQQRLDNQQKNLDLAEKIYETTQIKYREGVGSSLEINQSEQSLYQAQRNYTQALFDLLSSELSLYKALGK